MSTSHQVVAEGAIVSVCAWCPDKEAKDRAAELLGLRVSHGMRPACSERQLAQLSPVCGPVSCAVGSATVRRDGHSFDASQAAEAGGGAPRGNTTVSGNAPQPPAARIAFLPLAVLAKLTGLEPEEIAGGFGELHWVAGRDYVLVPTGTQVRQGRLPDLVGLFAVNGQTEAAQRLLRWLLNGNAAPGTEINLSSRKRALGFWWMEGAMA